MNWYKISQQQQSFDFMENDAYPTYWDKRRNSQLPALDMAEATFEEALDDCDDEQCLVNVLKFYKIKYDIVNFDTGIKVYSIVKNGRVYIIDPNHCCSLEDANDWIREIVMYDKVYQYITLRDFSKDFWQEVGEGTFVYHGTSGERIEKIMKQGLLPKDETRGINNRNTGSAVFTSSEEETPANYYDKILQIDVGAMKADGYMPEVSMEGPIEEVKSEEALAYKIGINDYQGEWEQGLDEGTIIFYGPIPPKYLKILD
jgi:hypothetical protein